MVAPMSSEEILNGAGAERDGWEREVVGHVEFAVGEALSVEAGGGGAPGSCEPMTGPATSLRAVRNAVTGWRIPEKTRSSLGKAGALAASAWNDPCRESSGLLLSTDGMVRPSGDGG